MPQRPDFETVFQFWTALLAERGLPKAVRWIFYEDYAREKNNFVFRLRSPAEANRIVRFAYEHLDPAKNPMIDPIAPLAIVAYALIDDFVIIGMQADVFTANEDVYREDWNIFFDTKDHIVENCRVAPDPIAWAQARGHQPFYLSELDYLVSVDWLKRRYGPSFPAGLRKI
jgi:hypothetical protein